MRGRDLLAVAVRMRDIQSEAADRSRIGRAYYAAFLESRTYVRSFLHVQQDRSSGSHRTVPAALGTVALELAEPLKQLRTMRNGADYDLDSTGIDFTSTADQACALAARIILGIDRLTSARLEVEPTSPLHIMQYLPNDPDRLDTVSFYLLSFPTLVPSLLKAISIAAEVFPLAIPSIDLAYGEMDDPPLQLRLASSNPDVMRHELYRLYMTRLDTEANADLRWFVVTPVIVSVRRIEEASADRYQSGSA